MKRNALFLVLTGWLIAPGAAQAYLDPATGSAVLQVIIGGLMGGLFIAKRYWGQLKARLTGRPAPAAKPTVKEPGSDGDRG